MEFVFAGSSNQHPRSRFPTLAVRFDVVRTTINFCDGNASSHKFLFHLCVNFVQVWFPNFTGRYAALIRNDKDKIPSLTESSGRVKSRWQELDLSPICNVVAGGSFTIYNSVAVEKDCLHEKR